VRDRRIHWGAGFLAACAALATLAPWLPIRDPEAQPDTLVLRNLHPLARVDVLALADGRRVYADEVRTGLDGALEYRRGARWTGLGPPGMDVKRDSAVFVLGTDAFGRDMLSRLIHGARISLAVGLVAASIALVVGGGVGLVSGLLGGWTDAALMRLTDLASSIPRLFLVLLLVALYRPSIATTIVVLGATTWMAAARMVRGEVLSLRERDYVHAARIAGAPPWRVGVFHVLPPVTAVLAVEGALRFGQSVLLEASLSFLGLGVPPPAASWGSLVADGRDRLLDAWWISTLPGLAIAGTVIALSLLGDGLRDRLGGRAGRSGTEAPSPAEPARHADRSRNPVSRAA